MASTIKVPSGVSKSGPVQTNNFWGNMTYGTMSTPVYTHPYAVWKCTVEDYYGFAISHQAIDKRVYGSNDLHNAPSYFLNPAGNLCIVLGSSDFDAGYDFTLSNLKKMSCLATLTSKSAGYMDVPLVQGIGMITGIYNDLIPEIHSQVAFKSITGGTAPRPNVDKYVIQLQDGSTWYMYVTLTGGQTIKFALKDSQHIIGSNSLNNCSIQVCCGDCSDYDKGAGTYATEVTLAGSVNGSAATYSLNYTVAGLSGTPIMMALPHHVASFTSKTSGTSTNVTLLDTVHGTLKGYNTNIFEFQESIPTGVDTDPWSAMSGFKNATYTTAQLATIKTALTKDVNDNDFAALVKNVDSMYYAGKLLDKFAYILYVCQYIVKDSGLTSTAFSKLQDAMAIFIGNKQVYPLCYETEWGGICSTGGMANGDTSIDFGNSMYNDHHFHYGYHIHAASMLAKVDKDINGGKWLAANKTWVQTLVRDVANPSTADTSFPVFRNFDWYIGHSLAHGITAYADGKDEESSSEDYNFSYAMKIWGQQIGDANMVNRANIMLAIQRRSMNSYMLYNQDNSAIDSKFKPNIVSGIKFGNRIDHATYFGTNPEYIHGIHMLPITPISSFIRSPSFVKYEYESFLKSRQSAFVKSWMGVVYLNVALYDPQTAWNFFSVSNFDYGYLDDGMSLSWTLSYIAGVMQ